MPNLNAAGVVDLGALVQAKQQQSAVDAGLATWVTEVKDRAGLEALMQRSMQHPVIVEFYSPRAKGAEQSSQFLQDLTNNAQGAWLLARLDVDAVPDVAQLLQINAVPMVIAFLAGQAAPLWQGTADEAQIKQVLTEVLAAASQAGLSQPAEPVKQERGENEADPRFAAAEAKLDEEDYLGARAEFEKVLEKFPGDAQALAGRAQAGLLQRLVGVDVQAVLDRGAAEDATFDEHLAAADVELTVGRIDEAFARLVGLVRDNAGDQRNAVRERLLELFDAVGASEPEVLKARRDLAAALF